MCAAAQVLARLTGDRLRDCCSFCAEAQQVAGVDHLRAL